MIATRRVSRLQKKKEGERGRVDEQPQAVSFLKKKVTGARSSAAFIMLLMILGRVHHSHSNTLTLSRRCAREKLRVAIFILNDSLAVDNSRIQLFQIPVFSSC